MMTTNTDDPAGTFFGTLVSTSFEPCAAFGPTAEDAAVCGHCGWLDAEHERPVAEVHALALAQGTARDAEATRVVAG